MDYSIFRRVCRSRNTTPIQAVRPTTPNFLSRRQTFTRFPDCLAGRLNSRNNQETGHSCDMNVSLPKTYRLPLIPWMQHVRPVCSPDNVTRVFVRCYPILGIFLA